MLSNKYNFFQVVSGTESVKRSPRVVENPPESEVFRQKLEELLKQGSGIIHTFKSATKNLMAFHKDDEKIQKLAVITKKVPDSQKELRRLCDSIAGISQDEKREVTLNN